MNFFKKKVSFTSAICPRCGENLTLVSSLEIAFCQNCGAQCIVENVTKKSSKTTFDKIIYFVERQQEIRRKEKVEKQRQLAEEQKRNAKWLREKWWVLALIFGALFTFSIIASLLGI